MNFGVFCFALASFASAVFAAPTKPGQNLEKRFVLDYYSCDNIKKIIMRRDLRRCALYADAVASAAIARPDL